MTLQTAGEGDGVPGLAPMPMDRNQRRASRGWMAANQAEPVQKTRNSDIKEEAADSGMPMDLTFPPHE